MVSALVQRDGDRVKMSKTREVSTSRGVGDAEAEACHFERNSNFYWQPVELCEYWYDV